MQNYFHQNILKATEVTNALVIQNGPFLNNGHYVIGSFITLMFHLVNVNLILITFSLICVTYHINLLIVFRNNDFNVTKSVVQRTIFPIICSQVDYIGTQNGSLALQYICFKPVITYSTYINE